MGITKASRLAATLIGAVSIAVAHAQPQQPTTEAQARYYVYGAFLTQAIPQIMSEQIALDPALERRLGVQSGGDRVAIYNALISLTDRKQISVRRATPDEIARYIVESKRQLKDPLFTLRAGDVALIVQYDMQANEIPFVGQLAAGEPPPQAKPVAVEPRAAPVAPVAVTPPVAPPPVASPAPVVRAPPPPPAPVVRAPPPPPAPVVRAPAPPPPVARAPERAPARPAEPLPAATGPCEVKPVMTEQDLINCRAPVGAATPPRPAPPPVATRAPERAPEPQPERKATPCVVKPVMSEEDLIACGARPR